MSLVVASYGGGVNSTAMLLGIVERLDAFGETDLKPSLILFADTGGEKPETYAYMERFSKFLQRFGLPEIKTVSVQSPQWGKYTLEDDCLRRQQLPSIAYGYKTCSQRFKLAPQEKYVNNWMPAKEAWKRGESLTRLIGYDAGEPHRRRESPDPKYVNVYPLIDWDMGREECIETIQRHGMCVPPKSSCFFCPNMREDEILDLRDQHPDLLERALEMERNARPNLITIKGLARDLSWQQIVDYDRDQLALLPPRVRTMPCECYDGE